MTPVASGFGRISRDFTPRGLADSCHRTYIGSTLGSHGLRTFVAAIALLLLLPLTAAAATPFQNIGSAAGPLNSVVVGNELSCQVHHVGDSVRSFYPSDNDPGDCGTLLAVDGVLYAPDFAGHGKSSTQPSLGANTPFTVVSQSGVTGAGSSSDPFRVTTVADAGASGLRISQVDSYAAGGES